MAWDFSDVVDPPDPPQTPAWDFSDVVTPAKVVAPVSTPTPVTAPAPQQWDFSDVVKAPPKLDFSDVVKAPTLDELKQSTEAASRKFADLHGKYTSLKSEYDAKRQDVEPELDAIQEGQRNLNTDWQQWSVDAKAWYLGQREITMPGAAPGEWTTRPLDDPDQAKAVLNDRQEALDNRISRVRPDLDAFKKLEAKLNSHAALTKAQADELSTLTSVFNDQTRRQAAAAEPWPWERTALDRDKITAPFQPPTLSDIGSAIGAGIHSGAQAMGPGGELAFQVAKYTAEGAPKLAAGLQEVSSALAAPPLAAMGAAKGMGVHLPGERPAPEGSAEEARAQFWQGLPDQAMTGVSDALEGAWQLTTPLIAVGAARALPQTVLMFGLTTGASEAASKLSKMAGADDVTSRFVGDLVGLGAATVGGKGILDEFSRLKTELGVPSPESAEAIRTLQIDRKIAAQPEAIRDAYATRVAQLYDAAKLKNPEAAQRVMQDSAAAVDVPEGPVREALYQQVTKSLGELFSSDDTAKEQFSGLNSAYLWLRDHPPTAVGDSAAAKWTRTLGENVGAIFDRLRQPIPETPTSIPDPKPTPGESPSGPQAEPKAIGSGQAPEPPASPEYASTQVNLPKEMSKQVTDLGKRLIPDEALAADGRETDPHVTLKFGLKSDQDVKAVKALLQDEPPITVTMGATSIFPASESGKSDVVKVDVDSPDLHRLNAKIAGALETTDTHPTYQPHATIAYVKPGMGAQFAGDTSLVGQTVTVNKVTFSRPDGTTIDIPLKGTQVAVAPPVQAPPVSPAVPPVSPVSPVSPVPAGGNTGQSTQATAIPTDRADLDFERAHLDDLIGTEFSNGRGEWAMVARDPKSPKAFIVQPFTSTGPLPETLVTSASDAAAHLWANGFRAPDAGALDRVSAGPTWKWDVAPTSAAVTPDSQASSRTPLGVTSIPLVSAEAAQPGGHYLVPTGDLKIDPNRFQYKSDVNAEGVTPRDRIEGPWNENLAGQVLAWKDPSTGELFIVNGHHRVEAAKRLGASTLPVRVLPDISVQKARFEGALVNIANNNGTPIDAAKVIRDGNLTTEDLRGLGVDPKRTLARDGAALAKLSDPLFQRVVSGDLPQDRAVAIGSADLSQESQMAVVKLLEAQEAKGRRDLTPGVVKALIEQVKAAPEVTEAGEQGNIFADLLGEPRTANLALEKAALQDWVSTTLGNLHRTLRFVTQAKRAALLREAGNVLNETGNQAGAAQAALVKATFDQLANKAGPINLALNEAATRVYNKESLHDVRTALLDAVTAAVQQELHIPASGSAGVMAPQPGGSGRGPQGSPATAGGGPDASGSPSPEGPSVAPSAQPVTVGQVNLARSSNQAETSKPVTQTQGRATDDAGVELEANRRNRLRRGLQWEDIAQKNPTLRVAQVQKVNVYPKPDYAQLIADGQQPIVAHIIKQVYDSIASKPVTSGPPTDDDLQRYIRGVQRVMAGAMQWANNPKAIAKWVEGQVKVAGSMSGIPTSVTALSEKIPSIYQTVYPNPSSQHGRVNPEYQPEIRVIGGRRVLSALQPGFDEARRAVKAVGEGWPTAQESWQRQGFTVVPSSTAVHIRAWEPGRLGRNTDAVWSVDIGRSSANTRLHSQFKSLAEAEAARDAYKPWLVLDKSSRVVGQFESEDQAIAGAREAVKRKHESVDERGISVNEAERVGPPRRETGHDISTEELKDAFGFKGVNFGNWMKGSGHEAERQLHLNHAYDAFHDLADLLGIPARAMSLNGMLGVAIGAQGHGGGHAAHFVPGVNEINLTRVYGAGALAHEFAHALDHYYATLGGLATREEPFLTEHVGSSVDADGYTKRGGKKEKAFGDELRPEISGAFSAIVNAMNRRPESGAQMEARIIDAKVHAAHAVDRWIKSMRSDFLSSKVQAAEFDAIAEKIKALNIGDGKVDVGHARLSPVVVELRDLYKASTGKSYSLDLAKGLQANIDHLVYVSSDLAAQRAHEPQHVSTQYAYEADKLDQAKKGKQYWSTNLEKFARAFDAFVRDRLTERTARNTYLSREGLPPEWEPQGEERVTIDNAFATLVDALEVKPGTDILYQSSEHPAIDFTKRVYANALNRGDGVYADHVLGFLRRLERTDGPITQHGDPSGYTIPHLEGSQFVWYDRKTDRPSGIVELVRNIDADPASGRYYAARLVKKFGEDVYRDSRFDDVRDHLKDGTVNLAFPADWNYLGLPPATDRLSTGELQSRLPEAGAVRDLELRPEQVASVPHGTYTVGNLKAAMHLSDEQAAAIDAYVKAIGIDTEPVRFAFDNGHAKGEMLYQANAPQVRKWYYSNIEHALGFWQPKGTSAQLLAHLGKVKGAMEEASAIGLDEWLKGREKVTRAEVQQYLDAHQINIQEVEKSEESEPDTMRQAITTMLKDRGVKYAQYQTPGGKNYREILLTVPVDLNVEAEARSRRIKELIARRDQYQLANDRHGPRAADSDVQNARTQLGNTVMQIDMLMRGHSGEARTAYKSPHWDEPNVLAHLRVNDRTIYGKRSLFIEEVQSDWARQGRSEGYRQSPAEFERRTLQLSGELDALKGAGTADSDPRMMALRAQIEQLRHGSVPDQPFKGNAWKKLALKRAIAYAAEHGYDAIGWTTGEMQQARYDLSKQVDSVQVVDWPAAGKGMILLSAQKGEQQVIKELIPENKLAEYIGKEPAERILAQDKDPLSGARYLSGEGLKVGGKWAENLYDKELPNLANEIGKKYGVKTGRAEIVDTTQPVRKYDGPTLTRDDIDRLIVERRDKWTASQEEWMNSVQRTTPRGSSVSEGAIIGKRPDVSNWIADQLGGRIIDISPILTVHSIDLPFAMREAIRDQGLPLFQGVKGSVDFLLNGLAIVRGLERPDFSTAVHEILGHISRRQLINLDVDPKLRKGITDTDIRVMAKWAGAQRADGTIVWDRTAEEKYARGLERILYEGDAAYAKSHRATALEIPWRVHDVFGKVRDWMKAIYVDLAASPINVNISPEAHEVFGRILTRTERVKVMESQEQQVAARPAIQAAGPQGTRPPPRPRQVALGFEGDQQRLFQSERPTRSADERKAMMQAALDERRQARVSPSVPSGGNETTASGETSSDAMLADEVAAMREAAEAAKSVAAIPTRTWHELNEAFRPIQPGKPGEWASMRMKSGLAEKALGYEQAVHALWQFRKPFVKLSRSKTAVLKLAEAFENPSPDNPVPEWANPYFEWQKQEYDVRKARFDKKGLGLPWRDHYLARGNKWVEPWRDWKEVQWLKSLLPGRRRMEGNAGFRNTRVYPTMLDRVEATGLEPPSFVIPDNDIAKMREMDQFEFGDDFKEWSKAQPLDRDGWLFVPNGKHLPKNLEWLPESIGTVWAPPTMTVREAYDKHFMEGAEQWAETLGGSYTRKPNGSKVWGRTDADGNIVMKFGGPEMAVIHEAGHRLDRLYDLGTVLRNTPNSTEELAALAELRHEGETPTSKFAEYVQRPREQVANAVVAYIWTPEKMLDVAPNIYATLDELVERRPETFGPMKTLQGTRSLVLGTREAEVRLPGPMRVGRYASHPEVVRMVTNYLSPGLAGRYAIYDAWRWLGNTLVRTMLAVPTFHFTGITIEQGASDLGSAIQEATSGQAGKAVKRLPTVTTAGIASAYRNLLDGREMRRRALASTIGSHMADRMVRVLILSGQRIEAEKDYSNQSLQKLGDAITKQSSVGTLYHLLPGALEMVAWPVLGWYIPMVKLGALWNRVLSRMGQFPADVQERMWASEPGSQDYETLNRICNEESKAIDAIYGLMVKDNLHWNKIIHNVLNSAFISPTWNLGELIGFGGGVKDIKRIIRPGKRRMLRFDTGKKDDKGQPIYGEVPENIVSFRLGWALATVIMLAYLAEFIQKVNGQGDVKSLLDVWHPRDGGTNPNGTPHRLTLPVQGRDLYAFAHDFPGSSFRTIGAKLNPAIGLTEDLMRNEDFSGTQIRDPDDPIRTQLKDFLTHEATGRQPIVVRNLGRASDEGRSWKEKSATAMGVQTASSEVERTPAEKKMREYLGPMHRTEEQAQAAQLQRDIRSGIQAGTPAGGAKAYNAATSGDLSRRQIINAIKGSRITGDEANFKRLTLDQALHVYSEYATPEERSVFYPLLEAKAGRGILSAAPNKMQSLIDRTAAALKLPRASGQ